MKKQKQKKQNQLKNFLAKYKVMLIFLIYNFALSFLIYKISTQKFMIIFMGIFFILFSFFKIINLKKFKESFSKYDLLGRKINFYGYVYPFVEIILGVLFLLNFKIKILSAITIFILTMTTIGVIEKLKKKQLVECACLGAVFKIPLSYVTIFENVVMIVMGIFLLI